ncbi:MAG: carboxypeptidase-like regulatory domain-containing protein [Saprospiraceae bacterium]
MQKLKLLVPLALFLSVFFTACGEDPIPGKGEMADVAFAGRIIDEQGDAVPDAQVQAGNELAVTDANGVFRLPPVNALAEHAVISVTKTGYFDFSRAYIVEDGATQTVTIQLLQKTQVGSLSATVGGAVDVPGGAKLTFPANAVTDQNGNAYAGTVRVFARYLDPADPNLGLNMPGDLTGINTAGEEDFLATYGMIAVEIASQGGQKLQIASGQEVELRMPIPIGQLASAPAEIPLWYYDEHHAHWIEEGKAQKVGNEYVGKVSHFSFWNCDAPFPLTQLHGQIFLENASQPLANAVVRLTMLSNGVSSFGWTDSEGFFGGCIPKDEALRLEVVSPENCAAQVFYTQDIGSFPGVSTLPPITIPASAQVPVIKVTGQLLNCAGQPLANGYAKIELGDKKHYIFPSANGQLDRVIFHCDNSVQTGEVVGYDLTNLLESAPVVFSTPPNAVNVGNITVCTALAEFIQYTLDGQLFVKIEPGGGLDVTMTTIAAPDSSDTSIRLAFENSGQLGIFPISSLLVNLLSFDTQAANTLVTNVTAFGNVGDLMIGTFGGNFQDFNGASHTISGSYRVIREW